MTLIFDDAGNTFIKGNSHCLLAFSAPSLLGKVQMKIRMLTALLNLSLIITVSGIDDCKIGSGIQSGQMNDKDMEEASGLAYSKTAAGILYTINDKGGLPRVIALKEDGQKDAFIELDGVDNIDYEDIATTFTDGRSFILVSDTGNNDFDRDPLSILKFQEPTVTGDDVTIDRSSIEELQVRYEGFSYDCEALGGFDDRYENYKIGIQF